MMFSDASSGGVAISEKNISVVAPMAIDTMTAKEKNLAGYKLWPGFKKSLTWDSTRECQHTNRQSQAEKYLFANSW